MALLVMYYRGEMLSEQKAKVIIIAERDSLKVAIKDIADINKGLKDTIDTTLKMYTKQQERMDEYMEQLMEATHKTSQVLIDLDKLRATENKKALAEPFLRGNAAHTRMSLSMCRAWGIKPDSDPRCSDN